MHVLSSSPIDQCVSVDQTLALCLGLYFCWKINFHASLKILQVFFPLPVNSDKPSHSS